MKNIIYYLVHCMYFVTVQFEQGILVELLKKYFVGCI